MITAEELQDAIKICQNEKNPNAWTCVKLSAYITILNSMYPVGKSGDSGVLEVVGQSEFMEAAYHKNIPELMRIIDRLMKTLESVKPQLYDETMREIREL